MLAVALAAVSINASGWRYQVDIDVYRQGARAILQQPGELYFQDYPTASSALPFTYPPFAAFVLTPLALLKQFPAEILMTVLSAGCLWWCLRTTMALAQMQHLALPATTCGLLLEPVTSTLTFGQINILLVALVIHDCLRPERTIPRGILTGIATAIKLTPGVLFLYFLARKDYRSACWMGGTFIVITALTALVRWQDSWQYFSATLWNAERIGEPHNSTNVAMMAALFRAGIPGAWPWFVLALGIFTYWAACRARVNATALIAIVIFGLIASPISWSHHWVWLLPGIVIAWVFHMRWWAWWALGATTIGQFHKWLPHGEWTPIQNLMAIHYVILGCTFIAATFASSRRAQRT